MSLSLRSFHLFFITVSVLLAVWVGVWGVRSYLATQNRGDLGLGAIFFVIGFALFYYGRRARRKLPVEDEE